MGLGRVAAGPIDESIIGHPGGHAAQKRNACSPFPIPYSPFPGPLTDSSPTAHPAFSSAWVEAWGHELNSNPAYQQAAATWEGDIVLEMAGDDEPGDRAVYLDLWHGVCRAARAATAADHSGARYLFRANRDAWRQVLAGKLTPATAILTGKLRLTRGSLADFLPYASAAEALLMTGGTVATTFADD